MSPRIVLVVLIAALALTGARTAIAAPIVETKAQGIVPSSGTVPLFDAIVLGPGGAVYASLRIGPSTSQVANISVTPAVLVQCNYLGQSCALGGMTTLHDVIWFVTTVPINAQGGITSPPAIGTLAPAAPPAPPGMAAGIVQRLSSYGALPYAIASDEGGALWVLEGQGLVARWTPGDTAVQDFPIPVSTGGPIGITRGPDGAMWFTQTAGNAIGRVATTAPETVGSMRQYPVPSPRSGLYGITTGPDGALWFAESRTGKIGRLTTGGTVTEFQLPIKGAAPRNLVAGPDGALWFTDPGTNAIGRITTAGAVTEYALKTPRAVPNAITVGGDGRLWFTMSGVMAMYGQLDPKAPPAATTRAVARITRNGRPVRAKTPKRKPKRERASRASRAAAAR